MRERQRDNNTQRHRQSEGQRHRQRGMKARHGVDKRDRTKQEVSTVSSTVEELEEEEGYQYCLLLRGFLYALVICVILTSLLLSHIVIIKTREQQLPLREETVSGNHPKDVGFQESDLRRSVENMVQSAINSLSFTDSTSSSREASAIGALSSSSIRKCGQQWSPYRLTGRCYGLKNHAEFVQLRSIHKVKTAEACSDLCCHLGEDCVTWQYWTELQLCKMGGEVIIRQHNEVKLSGHNGPWCEATPPVSWHGSKVLSRDDSGPTKWGSEQLSTKCFGMELAKQLLNTKTQKLRGNKTGTIYNEIGCKSACADDHHCNAWQYHVEQGCFFFRGKGSEELLCDPYVGSFDGMTKISI